MKRTLLLLASALALAGCSDSSNTAGSGSTNAASSGSIATAPVDYLNSAAKAKVSADKTVDTVALSKAIEIFNVQEGRFPNDLSELASKKYIPEVPTPPAGMKIDYDSKTGVVKIVKQ